MEGFTDSGVEIIVAVGLALFLVPLGLSLGRRFAGDSDETAAALPAASAAQPLGRGSLLFPVILVVALVYLGSSINPSFLSLPNITNIAFHATSLAIMAVGMTVVMNTGGVDLSVGSVSGLASTVAALLMQDGSLLIPALAIAIGVSIAVGMVNGVLIAGFGMPSFVVTLGTLAGGRGIAMLISQNRLINDLGPDADVLGALNEPLYPPFSNAVLVLAVLAIAAFAIRSRVQVSGAKPSMGVYVFSAITAGVAGIVMLSRLGAATPGQGVGAETQAVAAALIGGASVVGRSGGVLGAILGAIAVVVAQNELFLAGAEFSSQSLVLAVAILIGLFFEYARFRGAADA